MDQTYLKMLEMYFFAFLGWAVVNSIANGVFNGHPRAIRISNISGAAFMGCATCLSLAYVFPGMPNIFLSYLAGGILVYAFFHVVAVELAPDSIARGFLVSVAIIVTIFILAALAGSLEVYLSGS